MKWPPGSSSVSTRTLAAVPHPAGQRFPEGCHAKTCQRPACPERFGLDRSQGTCVAIPDNRRHRGREERKRLRFRLRVLLKRGHLDNRQFGIYFACEGKSFVPLRDAHPSYFWRSKNAFRVGFFGALRRTRLCRR